MTATPEQEDFAAWVRDWKQHAEADAPPITEPLTEAEWQARWRDLARRLAQAIGEGITLARYDRVNKHRYELPKDAIRVFVPVLRAAGMLRPDEGRDRPPEAP